MKKLNDFYEEACEAIKPSHRNELVDSIFDRRCAYAQQKYQKYQERLESQGITNFEPEDSDHPVLRHIVLGDRMMIS